MISTPPTLFYVVNKDSTITSLRAHQREAFSAHVSGKLAVAAHVVNRRALYNSCSTPQQGSLATAMVDAQMHATKAFTYLTAHTSATDRYNTWFGTYTNSHHSTVLSHFTSIASNVFSSFTYNCNCSDPGVYAFVYPNVFGHIYLCGAFWNAPTRGTDSKAGTIVHEASHFKDNGGTSDVAYGQPGCQALAQEYSEGAIQNADSHEYFAENQPALT